jgi:uncharacterized membrane protein YoaK (UPF0700 family)
MTNIDFDIIINLIHIFINGPFFIYIGLVKPNNILFSIILFFLAIIIVIAFIYRYLNKQLYAWLYVHLLLFATLLFYISYLRFTQQKIPDYLYSFLVAIGIAAIGYHIIKLVKHIRKNTYLK